MPLLVVSPNERILLHLSELDRFSDDPEVPIGACQEGIAQRLQVQIFNASRALATLQAEGLVADRLAHVRGAPKRRRAYFLTEKGRRTMQAIKADIGGRTVRVEHKGIIAEVPVIEAGRRLGAALGVTPSLLDIVEVAKDRDVLRPADFARLKPAPAALREYVVRSHGRPQVDQFFGRESELKIVSDRLEGGRSAAVLLWGIPGIGKSTLGSKLFDKQVGSRPLFWYTFHEWDSEASFLGSLAEFMAALGRTGLAAALRRGAHLHELYVPMLSDLSGCQCTLFMDDVQKPAKEMAQLLAMLADAVRRSGTGQVVMISRAVPSFYSRTDEGNFALEVQGLDRDSAWRMAQTLKARDAMRVVDESRGHPMLLRLMARLGASEARPDVSSFIEREVYSALSGQELAVLESLSVFRHPVPADAVPGMAPDVVSGLRQRGLLTEQEDGIWAHDLLREFFHSHLSADRRRALHRAAGEYCEKKPRVEWKLEAIHHFTEAEDWAAARRAVLANAAELAKEFPEEVLALISTNEPGSESAGEQSELLFLRGQLNESLGHTEQALADWEASLSLIAEGDPERRALVLESVARLQADAQRWSESLSVHEKALRLYEKSGDREGQAREWSNIGGVHRRKGDIVKAREAYTKALSVSTMDENRPAQAASLNNLALLDWDEGRLRDAEMRLKESVKLAHVVKDHLGEARGLENLGQLFRARTNLAEAANLMLESAEAFRRAGDIVEYKRLQAACAETLGEQGRHSEGIELCAKALERPELRRRPSLFQRSFRFDRGDAALSSVLVDLHRSTGDFKAATKELARYESIARSIGDNSLVAKGMLMSAVVSEDSGDLDSAATLLRSAEALLRQEGNHEGLVAVHMRSGFVEEKRGDDAMAMQEYQEAARHAEAAGNASARRAALDNLEAVRNQA